MSGREVIVKLLQRYMLLRWSETTLIAAAAFMISFGVFNHVLSLVYSFVASMLIALGVGASYAWHQRLTTLSIHKISSWLDQQFAEFEDSTDLLVRNVDRFSSLEQLQLARIEERLLAREHSFKLPHRLPVAGLAFVAAVVLLFALLSWQHPDKPQQTKVTYGQQKSSPGHPQLAQTKITIIPPGYSGLQKTEQSDLNIAALAGSTLQWKLNFDTAPTAVSWLAASGMDKSFTGEDGQFTLQMKLQESAIYQLVWSSSIDTSATDYFQITIQEDNPPMVEVTDMPQFSRYKWEERNQVPMTASLSDDFALTDATIVATVSKGSGESVKFREERMKFDTPTTIQGRQLSGKKVFDLLKLGMEPGDELYFYVEATDNRTPNPQRSRTQTYFIALLDTAEVTYAMDDGFGVDIMPDYFRSQRQLIIDTEKLLAEQKRITKEEFNRTSNELGYDQKVLRLRYGQFLGEEFATDVGPAKGGEEADHADAESMIEEFGHQHDTENEHHQVEEAKTENPQAAFGHSHDNTEEATFFTQSIKAKLRAALSLMWDSELQLRLYQPKQSLPHQYEILKLLKEISQDSRIYVHRMGFDPPPIKEEKRLTGELKDIQRVERVTQHQGQDPYPAIRAALKELNSLGAITQLDAVTKGMLQQAAHELASLAVAEPGKYLTTLSLMRQILDETSARESLNENLKTIKITLASVIPQEPISPVPAAGFRHVTDDALVKELTKVPNE